MVPPPVAIANIAVGAINIAITLCNALIDRHDLKRDVKESCYHLKEKLSNCSKKADVVNNYISQCRVTEIWEEMASDINKSLEDIKSRLQRMLSREGERGNLFARPRRKFRQPYDMEKKLSGLIAAVREIDTKIHNFQISNNEHAEANASNVPRTSDQSAFLLRKSHIANTSRDESASAQCVNPARVEATTPDVSQNYTLPTETTNAYSLVSDVAKGCKDLVVYSSRALVALGDEAVIRIQEALVARAIADCSESLRLLGNKMWYFCGSNTLPTFVAKMALMHNPDAARRKFVDMLVSASQLGKPEVNLGYKSKDQWVATTAMDVSFVNALIFKDRFRTKKRRAHGKARIANEINSELSISASDMVLILQAMRQGYFVDQGLVIVANGEHGLGWYRVSFICREGLEDSGEVSAFRLEYDCSLEDAGGSSHSPADIRDVMILNFLHVTEIAPEARELKERTGRRYSYMKTSLENVGNMFEGEKAIFDRDGEGVAYTELLEIACLYILQAGYYARCQLFVDSLIDTCDERQLVVWADAGHRYAHDKEVRLMVPITRGHGRMRLKQGREIAFQLLAKEFYVSVVEDAEERNLLASCNDLFEYGRFCAHGEVMNSWHDLLIPTVSNNVDVNFSQAALTGKGSYSVFVARNRSVRLKDTILLCDPDSDSIAVAFDGVSEMSGSLKVRIGELMETSESQRLRAAFFICRAAVRVRKDTSTRMLDVIRSRYMGLQGIERISVNDIVEDLDEGERRNAAVLVECMECLAMQGGYREDRVERSVFAALCSFREVEKRMLVTGKWPPLFGEFTTLQNGALAVVYLEQGAKFSILASRHGDVYRAQKICQNSKIDGFTSSFEYVCVQ